MSTALRFSWWMVVNLLFWDLCKTPPFGQSRRQTQISILEIFNIFLWLKFSPSLILTKIEHFSKVSVLWTSEWWFRLVLNIKCKNRAKVLLWKHLFESQILSQTANQFYRKYVCKNRHNRRLTESPTGEIDVILTVTLESLESNNPRIKIGTRQIMFFLSDLQMIIINEKVMFFPIRC